MGLAARRSRDLSERRAARPRVARDRPRDAGLPTRAVRARRPTAEARRGERSARRARRTASAAHGRKRRLAGSQHHAIAVDARARHAATARDAGCTPSRDAALAGAAGRRRRRRRHGRAKTTTKQLRRAVACTHRRQRSLHAEAASERYSFHSAERALRGDIELQHSRARRRSRRRRASQSCSCASASKFHPPRAGRAARTELRRLPGAAAKEGERFRAATSTSRSRSPHAEGQRFGAATGPAHARQPHNTYTVVR